MKGNINCYYLFIVTLFGLYLFMASIVISISELLYHHSFLDSKKKIDVFYYEKKA